MQLRIFEGGNRKRWAKVLHKGIRIGMDRDFLIPCDLRPLMSQGDAGGALGGAIVGGMMLGGVGAALGAMANGGKTGFVMQTLQGRELIGEVESNRYTELYAEVERFKREVPTLEHIAPKRKPLRWRGFVKRLALGPFDYWRLGPPWFVGALSLVILTSGWGWLVLPFTGKLIDQERVKRAHQPDG